MRSLAVEHRLDVHVHTGRLQALEYLELLLVAQIFKHVFVQTYDEHFLVRLREQHGLAPECVRHLQHLHSQRVSRYVPMD